MRDRERELREELQSHLEMATADRIDRGEAPEDAVSAARRELGNIALIQEATRDVWRPRWPAHAVQDIGYALRLCRRSPGFAAVALLSLALGIGANTALFQVVDAVRLQTLPVADPASLVNIHLADRSGMRGSFNAWYPVLTYPIWDAIRNRQQAFSSVFAWGGNDVNLANGGEVQAAHALWVSGKFFRALGIRPIAGRLLTDQDDRPGCVVRVVLSDAFWNRSYGSDPSAVGRALTLNARPAEIVGVAPPSFFGMEVGRSFDLAIPLCADPILSDNGKGRLASGTDWWLAVFGRLKPDWTIDRARTHLAALSPALFASTLSPNYPVISVPKYLRAILTADPAASGLSQLRQDYERPLWLLLGIAGLVLLIACANLANLLLARATAREREIAVRLSLGASRGRIIRQLLAESLLVAAIGAMAAVLLAGALSQAFVGLLDPEVAKALRMGNDWRVLSFTAALAVMTCILFGLAPALNATRAGAGSVIRGAGRGTTPAREATAIRRALVVLQVALSVVLLFGSLLFARSLHNVLAVDPGFRVDGVTIASVGFRPLGLSSDQWASARRRFLERVRALPGITSAAIIGIVPISGSSIGNDVWPEGDPSKRFSTLRNSAGPGYFATMGIPFLAGRDFSDADTLDSLPAAIVNEAFVAALGRGSAVVGTRLVREATPSEPEQVYEIIGVVKNSKYNSLKEADFPVAFTADAQQIGGAYLQMVIRSALPLATVTASVTRVIADINPRISIAYKVLADQIGDTLVRDRILATVSRWFGTLAVVLTLVGLYGLIAYTVTRRTNEIGVRLALGAGRSAIVTLILRETGILVAIGAAAGVLLAFAAGKSAAALLYGVRPSDPWTLSGAIAALVAIAAAASYAPARRATRIEPVIALRQE